MAGTTDNRKTAYAIIVYPESTDMARLRSHLESLHVPIAISPLHDKDVWTAADVDEWREKHKNDWIDPQHEIKEPKEGDPKKPHHHIMFDFGTQKKSMQQVLDLIKEAVPYVRYALGIAHKKAYIKYLCHLGSVDKPHYAVSDVIALSGFDLSPLYSITDGERMEVRRFVCGYVKDYGIYNLSELVDVLMLVDDPVMVDAVCSDSYFYGRYIDGVKERQTNPSRYAINVEEVARAILSEQGKVGEQVINYVTGEVA